MSIQRLLSRRNLRRFSPLLAMSDEALEKLLANTSVEEVLPGKVIFNRGEEDKKTIYLLEGDVELIDETGAGERVSAATEKGYFPLCHDQPRSKAAIAATEVKLIRVDDELLDILLTWTESANLASHTLEQEQSQDQDGEWDWLSHMIQSTLFHSVPSANIQTIFTRMELVPVYRGHAVIMQGDSGDFFYVIKSGRAEIVRRSAPEMPEYRLAELGPGDAFGEEALMADTRRNATVRMLTDGELMRLSKADFKALMVEPMLKAVSYATVSEQIAQHAWQLIDVRLESEFKSGHLEGAINIPLSLIRLRALRLSKEKPVVMCCDTGRRSGAAAFIMGAAGFDAYVLEGGIRTLLSEKRQAG